MAKEAEEEKAPTKGEEGDEAKEGEGGGEGGLEPPKKKLGKKMVLIGAAAALLLLGGGGAGLYFSGVLGGGETTTPDGEHGGGHEADAPADPHASAEKSDGHETGAPAFFSLGDILVNLAGDGKRPNFLKIKVSLELASEKDVAALEALKPRIIDNFQVYLRELRVEDLRGSAGLYRLREELLLRVTEAAQPIRVKDVLFQEMLVQ